MARLFVLTAKIEKKTQKKPQVVLSRCRNGHNRSTHIYLLNNEEQPECIPCNSNRSTKHVLIDCVGVDDVRQTFYNVNALFDWITNVDKILKCSREKTYNITYLLNIWFYSFFIFLLFVNIIIKFLHEIIQLKYCYSSR